MKEIYIIHCEQSDDVLSSELLAESIRRFDDSRDIIITTPVPAVEFSKGTNLHLYEATPNPTLNYFKSAVDVNCDRAIFFKSDQILTHFSTECWETLRNLSSIVTLKTKLSFAGEEINPKVYYLDSVNIANLGSTKNLNAVYFDFSKNARQLLGFCIDFSSNYDYNSIQQFTHALREKNATVALPAFPEFTWPSWVFTYVSLLFEEEFIEFDFLDNIDLSKQDYNIEDHIWSTRSWHQFLSYWVTDIGQLKIENFIQSGLVKYQNTNWLNDIILARLKQAYDQ